LDFQKRYETKQDLKNIKTLLIQYKKKSGSFPPEHRFVVWFKNHSEEKFRFKFPLDRWGNPIKYQIIDKDKHCQLESAGKDGVFGNNDDIKIK